MDNSVCRNIAWFFNTPIRKTMNIIVDSQAENYFYKKLHEHECGIHDDDESPKAGFFFSKEENTHVVFDKNFDVKLVNTISECFKFLNNK